MSPSDVPKKTRPVSRPVSSAPHITEWRDAERSHHHNHATSVAERLRLAPISPSVNFGEHALPRLVRLPCALAEEVADSAASERGLLLRRLVIETAAAPAARDGETSTAV